MNVELLMQIVIPVLGVIVGAVLRHFHLIPGMASTQPKPGDLLTRMLLDLVRQLTAPQPVAPVQPSDHPLLAAVKKVLSEIQNPSPPAPPPAAPAVV